MNTENTVERYLNKVQAAGELGISTATLDRRARAGLLTTCRNGREVMFRAGDIEKAKLIDSLFTKDIVNVYWLEPTYLRQARDEAGLSQHDLARLSGISRQKIANFETGITVPSLEDAEKYYRPIESSHYALLALIGIVGTNRDIAQLAAKTFEKELDVAVERHAIVQKLYQDQEAEQSRLMSKLKDYAALCERAV